MDGPGGLNYELVKCNLDLDPSIAQFQVAASTNKLAEYPVAFHCEIHPGFSTEESIIPCNYQVVNAGNAMDASGVFTVPIDGVYMFTFSCTSISINGFTKIDVRADSEILGYVWLYGSRSDETDDDLPGSVQVIANLKTGQKVDAYLEHGYISLSNFFTGHLLYSV